MLHAHTHTSPSFLCNDIMVWDAQMCMQSCRHGSNERAACKRRVPVTGRMYSPLPRSGSWSSRWAGRRCCGKERWAWHRCCCCVARRRHRSSNLACGQSGRQKLLTVTHHITLDEGSTCCVIVSYIHFFLYLFLATHANFLLFYYSCWPTFLLQPICTYYTCLL